MSTPIPESAPKKLRKRNVGKLATGGAAAVAGIALAATLFSVAQDGSASFDPDTYKTCNDGTLSPTDIEMSAFAITNVAQGDFGSAGGSFDKTAFGGGGYTPSTFTFDNRNCDTRADVRVEGVEVTNDDAGAAELAGVLNVYIERQGNKIYEGPLADWGQFAYVTNIPNARADGGSKQTYEVWAWVDGQGKDDLSYATTDEIELDFEVNYRVTDFAESNFENRDGSPNPQKGAEVLTSPPAAS